VTAATVTRNSVAPRQMPTNAGVVTAMKTIAIDGVRTEVYLV